MSYASDLTASLSNQLALVSPALVRPSRVPSSSNLAATSHDYHPASDEQVAQREQSLRSTLSKLRPHSSSSVGAAGKFPTLSIDQLQHLVDSAFPPFQADGATPFSPQLEGIEWVTVAQLAIAAHGTVLKTLMQDAARLGYDDDYWATTESDPWRTGFFLVQTGPQRFTSLATITASRLRQLTTSSLHLTSTREQPSLFDLKTWRRALPPSLFLTSVFPHLSGKSGLPSLSDLSTISSTEDEPSSDLSTGATSTLSISAATRMGRRTARSLFFLTLSPLALTRQEIAEKRAKIKKERESLATKIGDLTLEVSNSQLGKEKDSVEGVEEAETEESSLTTLLSTANGKHDGNADPSEPPSLEDIRRATWTTLRQLDMILTPSSSTPSMSSLSSPPTSPADLAHSLSFLLTKTLPSHSRSFSHSTSPLSRPSFLVRSWPYLLSIPLATYVTARTLYSHRASLVQYAQESLETVQRFLIDWVVEPVKKILVTVRGGDDGLTIMGRDSLKSDLASLERMVVDFGRDEYHLSSVELEALAERVREGDLTTVLKAWEQDIKSPIKSAVKGSLIRTLLIQVQKVKVDVALAMDGIEKMLKSQQLTFGFVGVAPSMLVIVAVARWVRGMARSDGGAKRNAEERKKCWLVMRQLDLLLSPPRPSQSLTPSTTQGLILLSLSSLRTYAHSRQFPAARDTQLVASFLEDVRALEDLGARADKRERKVLLERLRRWGNVLGWEDKIKA